MTNGGGGFQQRPTRLGCDLLRLRAGILAAAGEQDGDLPRFYAAVRELARIPRRSATRSCADGGGRRGCRGGQSDTLHAPGRALVERDEQYAVAALDLQNQHRHAARSLAQLRTLPPGIGWRRR